MFNNEGINLQGFIIKRKKELLNLFTLLSNSSTLHILVKVVCKSKPIWYDNSQKPIYLLMLAVFLQMLRWQLILQQ